MTFLPPFNKSKLFTVPLKLSTLYEPFGLGRLLAFFRGKIFPKIKGRETLSKSHSLNTADDNTGLTDSFPTTRLPDTHVEFKFLLLKSLDLCLFI
jgi:hypothetical protein